MFEPFYGNRAAAETLAQMIGQDRIPQTILLNGPEGIGKATLARRFAAEIAGDREKIEKDDLSLPENANLISDREKMPADKRNEDPLLFASHLDFVTFRARRTAAADLDPADAVVQGARAVRTA